MTVSLWNRTHRLGDLHCDVCVIGAGIAGLSAALALNERGIDALVVDRSTIGGGASTRNAGFLMRGTCENYARAADLWGRERAADLWRLTERNLARLRALGVDRVPSFRPTPSCLLALRDDEREELARSHAMLVEDGFASRLIERADDSAWRSGAPLLGLVNPGDATVNSREAIEVLAGRLARPVLEHQEVHAIESSSSGVSVRAKDATVHCARALCAVNAYAGLLDPRLAQLAAPRRGQMLAINNPGLRLDFAYYANHGSEYFRQTPDGLIAVGGCRTYHADTEVGYEDRVTDAVQQDLERFAQQVLGVKPSVVARWSGVMGFSPDGLPVIGPTDPDRRVWFCGGFTGHGMSMGCETARAATACMLDDAPNPFPLSRFKVNAGR